METAKGIDSAESTIIARLQKDHAPKEVIAQEKSLLDKASLLTHGAAKRESEEEAKKESLKEELMETAKGIDSAESTIIARLQKDHAPKEVIAQEKSLLDKASFFAHGTAKQESKVTAEDAQEKVTFASQSAASALSSYADSMAKLAKEDDAVIKETRVAKDEAEKALSLVKASDADKAKVSKLLEKAESFEQNALSLDEKSEEEAKKESLKEEQMETAKDIDSAESAIVAQLQRDHAPKEVIAQEKSLLDTASFFAHDATEEQSKVTAEIADKQAALVELAAENSEQKPTAKVHLKEAEETPVRTTADDADDLRFIPAQAKKQPAVHGFLRARKSNSDLAEDLVAKNLELKSEHSKLRRDHLQLQKQVQDENRDIDLQNEELSAENEVLKHALDKTS